MSTAAIVTLAAELVHVVSDLVRPGPPASESDAILGKIRDAVATVDDAVAGKVSYERALERLAGYRAYRTETQVLERAAIDARFGKG